MNVNKKSAVITAVSLGIIAIGIFITTIMFYDGSV